MNAADSEIGGRSEKVEPTRDSTFALSSSTSQSRKLFLESLKGHSLPALASSHQTQQIQSACDSPAALKLLHRVNEQLVQSLVAGTPSPRNDGCVRLSREEHMTNIPISISADVKRTSPLVNLARETDFPFHEKKRGALLFDPSSPRSKLNAGKNCNDLSIDMDSFTRSPMELTSGSSLVTFAKVKHGKKHPLPSQLSNVYLANKRRFNETSSNMHLSNAATKSSVQHSPSLLHHCCKRHSQSASVVSAVLGVDSQAPLRRFPRSCVAFLKRRKQSEFDYPINIALHHDAPLQVLRLLAEASSGILVNGDGPEWCCALSCALYERRDIQVISLLLGANPDQIRVRDRHLNYPIHVACLGGASLEIVKLLATSYRHALRKRNFHGQTPVEIAISSTLCGDDTVDFLKQTSYEALEEMAVHLDGDIIKGAVQLPADT